MNHDTLLPFDLPAVGRKKAAAAFDGSRRTNIIVKLTRRIRATAAMAGTPALAASVAQREIADPILALGRRYQDAVAERERECAAVDRIWDAFPETAKDGWPLVDRSLPIFRDFPENNDPEFMIGRADLHDIEKFNAVCERAAADNPEELVAERADGAARIRWFEDYMSTCERLREESGYNAQHERYEAAAEAVDEIEAEIIEMRPVSIAGLSVRLRVLRDFLESNNTSYGELAPREEMEWQDRLTLDVMEDLQRLTGERVMKRARTYASFPAAAGIPSRLANGPGRARSILCEIESG